MRFDPTQRHPPAGLLFALLLLLCTLPLHAQRSGGAGAVHDSSAADSAGVEDSTRVAAADSLPSTNPAAVSPYPRIGVPLGSEVADGGYIRSLGKGEIVRERYFTITDLLPRFLPAILLSQGAPGLRRFWSYAGGSPGSISILCDGRVVPSATPGGIDTWEISPESIERLEILQGGDAMLSGEGTALRAINAVQAQYDVEGSYVRLWYAQGAAGLNGEDVTYARNVSRRTNLSLGIRHLGASGEFDNQSNSGLSLRGSVQWNVPGPAALSFSGSYADLTRGLNGGLTATSSRDPFASTVVDATLSEERVRKDWTLAVQYYPGEREVRDSTVHDVPGTRIDGALYYSSEARTLSRGGEPLHLTSDTTSDSTTASALRSGMRLHLYTFGEHLQATGELGFERRLLRGDSTDGSFGRLAVVAGLPLGSLAELRAGGAIEGHHGVRPLLSGVGEARVRLSDPLHLIADVRFYSKHDQPSNATLDSETRFAEMPTAMLMEAGADYSDGALDGRFDAWVRTVQSAIGSGAAVAPVFGASLSGTIPYGIFRLRENLQLIQDPDGNGRFPRISSTIDLFVQMALSHENLDLRAGVSASMQSPYAGTRYDPMIDAPVVPGSSSSVTQGVLFSVWGTGRIGSAYLHLALENLLDAEYWTIYRYPEAGRHLTFGISWALID